MSRGGLLGHWLRREISSDSAMVPASTARSPWPRRSRACRRSLSERRPGGLLGRLARPGIRRGQDGRHDGPAAARDRSCRSAPAGDVPAISGAACLAGGRRNARQADFGIQAVPIGEPKGVWPPGRLAADRLADERRLRQDLPELIETTGWAKSGCGRDPRCASGIAHCGYEPTAVLATMGWLGQALRAPAAAAVIGAASPAAASLNATAAVGRACHPGRLRPWRPQRYPGRPAGIWALGCGDDGR